MSRMRTLSNFSINEDGELVESRVKLYPLSDYNSATYEVEFQDDDVGLILETDDDGLTMVGEIEEGPHEGIIRRLTAVGDILLEVNGKNALELDFEDLIEFIQMLKVGQLLVRMKFLKPNLMTLAKYLSTRTMRTSVGKDLYGFVRTLEYLNEDERVLDRNKASNEECDESWDEFLNYIGGADNLFSTKPLVHDIGDAATDEADASNSLIYEEQQSLIRRGIPSKLRNKVWYVTSGAQNLEEVSERGYYQALVARCESGELDAHTTDEVEKDLCRTFPEHEYFSEGTGVDQLRRMLQAHALHNPDVGYCQSLNFVAGMLLLNVPEEQAFWLLCIITQHLMPPRYYAQEMSGMYVDQNVLAHIVRTRLPRIDEVMRTTQLQTSFIAVPWFMCLFVTTLRPPVAMRVWDIVFNEGACALFRFAVALFKLNEKELVRCKDGGEVLTLLRGAGERVADPEVFVNTAFHKRGGVDAMKDDAMHLARSAQKAARSVRRSVSNTAMSAGRALASVWKAVSTPSKQRSASQDEIASNAALSTAALMADAERVNVRLAQEAEGDGVCGRLEEEEEEDDPDIDTPTKELNFTDDGIDDGDIGRESVEFDFLSAENTDLERKPKHFVDFTDEEIATWRGEMSGQLPNGARVVTPPRFEDGKGRGTGVGEGQTEESEAVEVDGAAADGGLLHNSHAQNTPDEVTSKRKTHRIFQDAVVESSDPDLQEYFRDPFSPRTEKPSCMESVEMTWEEEHGGSGDGEQAQKEGNKVKDKDGEKEERQGEGENIAKKKKKRLSLTGLMKRFNLSPSKTSSEASDSLPASPSI